MQLLFSISWHRLIQGFTRQIAVLFVVVMPNGGGGGGGGGVLLIAVYRLASL